MELLGGVALAHSINLQRLKCSRGDPSPLIDSVLGLPSVRTNTPTALPSSSGMESSSTSSQTPISLLDILAQVGIPYICSWGDLYALGRLDDNFVHWEATQCHSPSFAQCTMGMLVHRLRSAMHLGVDDVQWSKQDSCRFS